MTYRPQWLTALITLALAFRVAGAAEAPVPQADLRAAVAGALPPLAKGAAGHRESKSCFACHHQGLPIMAMATARARGVTVDSDQLDGQLKSIVEIDPANLAESQSHTPAPAAAAPHSGHRSGLARRSYPQSRHSPRRERADRRHRRSRSSQATGAAADTRATSHIAMCSSRATTAPPTVRTCSTRRTPGSSRRSRDSATTVVLWNAVEASASGVAIG